MAPKRTTRARPAPETTTTTTSVTNAQLQAMIDQGVAATLATRDATRNGDDSPTSGTGTEGVVELTQWFERMETVFRISNCSVDNQIKFSTCTLLAGALTWWNSHVRIDGQDVAYAMTWTDLRKKMTNKYCPRNEIKKLEVELWNLKVKDKVERYVGGFPDMIQGSVVASKPKTIQEATEMASELMDKKINTITEGRLRTSGSLKTLPETIKTNNDKKTRGRTLAEPTLQDLGISKKGCPNGFSFRTQQTNRVIRWKCQRLRQRCIRGALHGKPGNNVVTGSRGFNEGMSRYSYANITATTDEDKSKEKPFEDVPVVQEFS
ncbi:reverse transcriptase domain-containing protein [Tanacetum coccineum]